MEAVRIPYHKSELANPDVVLNRHFLERLEDEARRAAVCDHPFLVKLAKGVYGERAVRFAFIQFSLHVRLFTSCLGHLLGMAPTIRERAVLFDNVREEMGHGELGETHYMLYLRMLSSMGISAEECGRAEPAAALELLNDGLDRAVKRSFITGLAWLGIGGELTIPNNFPYLAQAAKATFANLDLGFFAHHGEVDQGHSDDSNLLLAMQIHSQDDRDLVRAEVMKSLHLRALVWDELATQAARL